MYARVLRQREERSSPVSLIAPPPDPAFAAILRFLSSPYAAPPQEIIDTLTALRDTPLISTPADAAEATDA